MEIIRLIEGTDLPVGAMLRQMGVPRSTFYGWVQRYEEFGFDGLHDKTAAPQPRWNKISLVVHDEVLDMALARTDLSPRELACSYTDEKRDFVSESSVYQILKSSDLITSPAYVLMSASDRFQHPTTRVHEM
jgi:transposase